MPKRMDTKRSLVSEARPGAHDFRTTATKSFPQRPGGHLKFIVSWTLPATYHGATERFMKTGGMPPPSVS